VGVGVGVGVGVWKSERGGGGVGDVLVRRGEKSGELWLESSCWGGESEVCARGPVLRRGLGLPLCCGLLDANTFCAKLCISFRIQFLTVSPHQQTTRTRGTHLVISNPVSLNIIALMVTTPSFPSGSLAIWSSTSWRLIVSGRESVVSPLARRPSSRLRREIVDSLCVKVNKGR
jgi:hypothetical protein